VCSVPSLLLLIDWCIVREILKKFHYKLSADELTWVIIPTIRDAVSVCQSVSSFLPVLKTLN
jgi:hypothetical protein